MSIDPWGSEIIEDYERIFVDFGVKRIPEHIRTGLKHISFERGIVIGHRDFEKVYQRIVSGRPFINMTGIATSGELHFGHKMIIDIFKFFKDCGGRNYFAICDIDAYVSRPDSRIPSLEVAKKYAVENLSHALALGLDEKDVYVQSRKERRYYEFAFELSKKITESAFRAIYGHLDIGKVAANLLQYADILHPQLPEYEGKMPSVTVIAAEQDPHIRAVRDIAARLPYDFELPSALIIVHLPGLKAGRKMSKSEPETCIFLKDAPEVAARKIMNAFTGGQPTVEEQRKLGGKPEICRVYEFLKFNHPDSAMLRKMYEDCVSGRILCGECKLLTAEFVKQFLERHREKLKDAVELAERIVYG
ncbi:tryptophan--tRNA ligase [Candidatus Bathyarchaeota archaeon]|nr:tryptophan--tRNA ligase [Candidatus Bathyarchaeota archaeon]